MADVRLIDANKLKELLAMYLAEHIRFPDKDRTTTFVGVLDWVDSAPTIEAEPVRHGRWIRMNAGFTKWQCSACGIKYHDICWNFCPHCGAKMDGEDGGRMADFGLNRNGSGYYDETAYKAFMGMAKAGDIWTTFDGREEVLILRNQGTLCNCLSLTDKASDARCIEVDGGYTNPGMVKYLFNQRLGRFVKRIPDGEFAGIMEAVEDALGFGKKAVDRRAEAHALLDMILDKVGGL